MRRYDTEQVLILNEVRYNVYDHQEERFVAENLIEEDAELIATALNYFKNC